MTIQELNALSDRDFIAEIWGKRVLDAIDRQDIIPMTMNDFLGDCHTHGGDWGGMLLSGIEALYPEVYEAIPDEMGHFAWRGICTVLELLNIKPEVIKI